MKEKCNTGSADVLHRSKDVDQSEHIRMIRKELAEMHHLSGKWETHVGDITVIPPDKAEEFLNHPDEYLKKASEKNLK